MSWFQSFAGIAFRWQDEATQSYSLDYTALSSPVVFSIVSGASVEAPASTVTVSSQTVSPTTDSESARGVDASSLFSAPPRNSGSSKSSASAGPVSTEQGSAILFSN